VSFVTITLCVSLQRVFIVVSVYFVIDTVRKLLQLAARPGFLGSFLDRGITFLFATNSKLARRQREADHSKSV